MPHLLPPITTTTIITVTVTVTITITAFTTAQPQQHKPHNLFTRHAAAKSSFFASRGCCSRTHPWWCSTRLRVRASARRAMLIPVCVTCDWTAGTLDDDAAGALVATSLRLLARSTRIFISHRSAAVDYNHFTQNALVDSSL